MHNIYSEKFLSHRQPAWHKLGLVTSELLTGTQAAEKLGLPQVYTEEIKTSSGLVIPDFKAIIGKDGQKEPVCFSVVSKEYHEITHFDFVRAWDRATNGAAIETMGLLGKGETLFLTTKLPAFSVKGEEMVNYLMAYNPLTGDAACTGRVTPVRVVCQNTLNASANRVVEQFRVIHTQAAATQIERWLKNVWETATMQTDALKEAYSFLMEYNLQNSQTEAVLNTVYPNSLRPDADETTDEGLTKLAEWEIANKGQVEHRELVTALYEGVGVGSELETAKGTAWGLFNAVVEYEDFGKKFRRSSSAVFGAGSDRKQKAMSGLLTLV
ncbi:MAG: DUF932 domain-containing protein [Dehalococcoidales bacterium]